MSFEGGEVMIPLGRSSPQQKMVDVVTHFLETFRQGIGNSLEKELTELIYVNPWIVLYLNFSTKDIFWMDNVF